MFEGGKELSITVDFFHLLSQFNAEEFIDIDAMRLSCAQVFDYKNSKHSVEDGNGFIPWVIDFKKDFEKAFDTLRLHPELLDKHSRKTLIALCCGHWTAMELSFKDTKNPKLLAVELDVKDEDYRDVQIKIASMGISLYVGDFALQRSGSLCAFFALNTARHLVDIEQYIPGKVDLFVYLESNLIEELNGARFCRLPLRLNLSAQTNQLWQEKFFEYSGDEKYGIVNRKGECFRDFTDRHYEFFEDPKINKSRNMYIRNFGQKMGTRNREFVEKMPASKVFSLTQNFSLPIYTTQSPVSVSGLDYEL